MFLLVLIVFRFYGPANTIEVMWSRSVNLSTLLTTTLGQGRIAIEILIHDQLSTKHIYWAMSARYELNDLEAPYNQTQIDSFE